MQYRLWLAKKYHHLPRDIFLAIMKKPTKKSIGKWVALGKKYPSEYIVQSQICFVYRIYRRRKEASKQWNKIERRFSNSASLYYMRSNWEVRNKNYMEAIFYTKRCLKLDTSQGMYRNQANYRLAICFFELGIFKQAEMALKKVSMEYRELLYKDYRGKGKAYILDKISSAKV